MQSTLRPDGQKHEDLIMTLRLDTTSVLADSSVWSPAADSYLQFSSLDATARVDVQVRCDASAPWVSVAQLSQRRPIDRIAQAPFMKLVPTDLGIKVWDNE
jgi:hypothetical protein